jgi:hypothetical protein
MREAAERGEFHAISRFLGPRKPHRFQRFPDTVKKEKGAREHSSSRTVASEAFLGAESDDESIDAKRPRLEVAPSFSQMSTHPMAEAPLPIGERQLVMMARFLLLCF